MRIPNVLVLNRTCRGVLFFAVGFLLAVPHGSAQCLNKFSTVQGFSTMFNCNSAQEPSFATVDANQFAGDICARILASLELYYDIGNGHQINYGIVVDARGVNPGNNQPCSGNPFAVPPGVGQFEMPPSTVVLLPSGTIRIQTTWALPAFTRIIGQGPGVTILQANGQPNSDSSCGSSSKSVDMIDMGCTNTTNAGFYTCSVNGTGQIVDCPGIAIEHLGLDGANVSGINGIVNNSAQELSYVQDVAFSNITGTALSVQGIVANNQNGTSNNSGPYTNLSMSNVGTCLSINGTIGTRGVHGLNCSTSGTSSAAVDIESSNNSLEDISLSGSNTDGILIGHTAAAQNNVLFNIGGSGFTNLIHISGNNGTSQTNCPGTVQGSGSSVYNVCDLTIMGVRNGSSGKTTILDQVGGPKITDASLGIYMLGEPVQDGPTSGTSNSNFLGNSHITTSLNWATWLVGASQPSPLSPCGASVGSLYSVTGTGSGQTLWECEKTGWVGVK